MREGATALITGGSSGIGAAAARLLAERGLHVAATYRSNRFAAEDLVARLPGKGHLALQLSLDEPESIAASRDLIADTFGALDVLVNSGGATEPVPADNLDALDDSLFARMLAINLSGPFAVVRAMHPLLERSERAVIVNVSSIAARTGVGSNLAYCASKGGLDTLTVGLAKALAPKIRVLGVAPAGVDTGFVPGRSAEGLKALADSLPLRHVTTAEDVARAISACVFDLTSSTGITIAVDEGRSI